MCVYWVARFVCVHLSQRSGCRQGLGNLPLDTSVLVDVLLLMHFFFSLAITCPPFLYSYVVPHSFISFFLSQSLWLLTNSPIRESVSFGLPYTIKQSVLELH